MANPVLSEKAFDYQLRHANEGTMTINGAINKSIILTLVLMLSAMVSVFFVLASSPEMLYPAAIGSSIGAFVLALIMTFKKELAKVLSILYAILEGVAIGAISYVFNAAYDGIVVQAVFSQKRSSPLSTRKWAARRNRWDRPFRRPHQNVSLRMVSAMPFRKS